MNHLLKRLLGTALATALIAFAPPASRAEGDLTNELIVQMIEAELPESTIINAIKADPSGLDSSALALIELKKKGASKEILNAVSGAQLAGETGPATPVTGFAAMPQLPNFNEVVIISGERRTNLQLGNGEISSTVIPFAPSKTYMKFKGKNSPLRVASGKLSIEFFNPSNVRVEEQVALLRPAVKRNHRSVEIGSVSGFFVYQSSDGNKDVVEVSFEEVPFEAPANVSMKKYRLTPKEPLAPGEYVFTGNAGQWYDFGVD